MNDIDCPCTLNETEFFDPINKQIVLEKAQWVDIHPVNTLSTSTPIEFYINGSSDEFLDLNNTMLQLKVKVVNSTGEANLIAADNIAPINNWLHSMFSDISLTISGTQIEGGNYHYPYKAYLSNLLTHSKGSKETHLIPSGWYKDTAGKFDNNIEQNEGFTKRKALVAQSTTVELCGPLLLDFFLQNKYLLHNVDVALKLMQTKPEFQIMIKTADAVANKANAVKVVISSAILYVRRVKALPSKINMIEESLNMHNVVYPLQRSELVTFTISQGSVSFNREAIFRGQMPKLIIVGFVRNDSFNGVYARNPFNFQNLNITNLALYREGESIPSRPLTPDFANNLYYREYMSLIQALELFNKADDVDITPDEFKNGYSLFGFNLTPDLCVAGHAQPIHDGNIRLEVQFANALETTMNCIIFGIFDGRIEITKHRNIIQDYKI